MKKVLMIVGSLRRNSFNQQLADAVSDMMYGRAQAEVLAYADLPFMNQDIEFPAPQSVERVRRQVQEADCLWIFTPEYNCQIPGVLKNALDWLSRPLTPGDPQRVSAVTGKPAAIAAVAGRSAGAGARKNLYDLLRAMNVKTVGGDGVGVALDGEAFRTGELTLSEQDKEALRALMERLLAE